MTRLPADRLLHTFRINAGLPSNAAPLGGWEGPKVELRGHFTGHYLSACAQAYASAGDQEMKARGDEIVAGLARCQSAGGQGGYLSAFPLELFDRLDRREKVWAPFYTIHKIMAGLLDMHEHAGNREALGVVTRMAQWADEWTAAKPEPHMQDILKTEFGGMSEVLYNLAAVTGEDRWARAGDRFQKKEFIRPLAARRDELRGLHANTHIPQVIGAARRYELSGDGRFHDVADFFWETIVTARTYSTGGSSNNELWLTEPHRLALEMHAAAHHQECCCAYNMMKLTRHLYSWTGDPRYIDYYERNLLNHRLGTIQPETGHTTYFLSLTPGAWKTLCTDDRSFWCCTGTAVEEYTKLADTIYHHDADGVFVNLFIASELDWADRGIRLRQETKFPDEARTAVVIGAAPAGEFALRLRIPGWLESAPAVRLNGRRLEAGTAPGGYLTLLRKWKSGDRVELELPMTLRSEPLADDRSLQSFVYGPLVLAADLGGEGLTEELVSNHQGPQVAKVPMASPVLQSGGKALLAWMKPAGSGPLTFEAASSMGPLRLSPIQQQWKRFAIYFPVA